MEEGVWPLSDERAEALSLKDLRYNARIAVVRWEKSPFLWWRSEWETLVCVELLSHITHAGNVKIRSTDDLTYTRLEHEASKFMPLNLSRYFGLRVRAGRPTMIVQDTVLVALNYAYMCVDSLEAQRDFVPAPEPGPPSN